MGAEWCVIECHGEGTVTEAWVVMRVAVMKL